MPHLPQLPEKLKPELYESATTNQVLISLGDGHSKVPRQGQLIDTALYTRVKITEELKNWVDENITKDYINLGVMIHNPFTSKNAVLSPHVDVGRKWALNYMFDEGGDQVRTIFYDIDNPALPVQHPKLSLDDPYFNLKEIESCAVGCWNWVLLRVESIHSVEFLTRPRLGLTISFAEYPARLFK